MTSTLNPFIWFEMLLAIIVLDIQIFKFLFNSLYIHINLLNLNTIQIFKYLNKYASSFPQKKNQVLTHKESCFVC